MSSISELDTILRTQYGLGSYWITKVKELVDRRQKEASRLTWSPLWKSEEEVALVYYMAKKYTSLTARIFNVSERTLYNLINSVEKERKAPVYNEVVKQVVKIDVDPNKLLDYVNKVNTEEDITTRELLRMGEVSVELLKTLLASKIEVVRRFIEDPVMIYGSRSKHKYNSQQIYGTLRALAEIMTYILRHKDQYPIPPNPDKWTKEHEPILIEIIQKICAEKGKHIQLCARDRFYLPLRRIRKFYEMGLFKGKIGYVLRAHEQYQAVKGTTRIKDVLYPEDLKALYNHYKTTGDNEYKAWFEIAMLHILTGAREGYRSIANKIDAWRVQKIERYGDLDITSLDPGSLDLDSDLVDTSLVGLKWHHFTFSEDGSDFSVKIYEQKTGTTWDLSYCFLPKDLCRIYYDRYQYAIQRKIKSVVKTILNYYNIPISTLGDFERWYTSRTRRYTDDIVGEGLNPHRLRATHISLLYELGVPLEVIIKKGSGFGVGWEDVGTAVAFYWRLTQERIRHYFEQARDRAQNIFKP